MPKAEQYVMMVHKDFKDRAPAKVLKATFDKIWKEKGWEIAPEKESASASSKPVPTSSGGGSDK